MIKTLPVVTAPDIDVNAMYVNIPLDQADAAVRHYAFIMASFGELLKGEHDNEYFWEMFLHTDPIAETDWPLYYTLVVKRFPERLIRVPVSVIGWVWQQGQWTRQNKG